MKKVLFFVAGLMLLSSLPACTEKDPAAPLGPVLEEVVTESGKDAVTGDRLILYGSNFSAGEDGNEILFDNNVVDVIFLEVASDRIVLQAPHVSRPSVYVKVRTSAGESNQLVLKYDQRRCDSVALFRGAKVEKLRSGVVWTSTITTWKGQPRSLNVVSIAPSEFGKLGFTSPSSHKKTSVQCQEVDALLGINGQYFNDKGQARDFLKINGEVKQSGEAKRSKTFASGVLVFDGTSVDIKPVNANEGASTLPDRNVMCSGPHLVDNGEYPSLDLNSTHNTTDHPRTAVAVTWDGHLIFATIDGRFVGRAVGMSSTLMQEYMTLLGARSALNLDGGGSTTLYIKGLGVVNHACDDYNWNNPVERAVGSIIYLK